MSNNLVTTEKFYSLFHLAEEAVAEAHRVKHEAFIKADHNPTRENINAFLEASKALDVAEENQKIVKGMKKWFRK